MSTGSLGSASSPMRIHTASDLDIAGLRAHPRPTERQKVAGNYAKAHVKIHNLHIAIETPRGGVRLGKTKAGKMWAVTMPAHYGYVKGTRGADGDGLDVYVGPHVASKRVFALDQVDADTKRFDEHKFFLAFPDEHAAAHAYHKSFSDGRAKDRIGKVTEIPMHDFKAMVGRARVRAMHAPVAKQE